MSHHPERKPFPPGRVGSSIGKGSVTKNEHYNEAAARGAALSNRAHSNPLVSQLAGMLWNAIEFRAEDRERYAVLVETSEGDHCCLMDGDKVVEQYPCTCWRSELAAKIRGVKS